MLALGHLADDAWQKWKQTPAGQARSLAYEHVTHPTEPESSSGGDPTKLKQAITAMLQNWNQALTRLYPQVTHPDRPGPLVPYGDNFQPSEHVESGFDVPGGVPEWMRSPQAWAQRQGTTGGQASEHAITIPRGVI